MEPAARCTTATVMPIQRARPFIAEDKPEKRAHDTVTVWHAVKSEVAMRYGLHAPHSVQNAAHLASVVAVAAVIVLASVVVAQVVFDSAGSGLGANSRPMIMAPLPR